MKQVLVLLAATIACSSPDESPTSQELQTAGHTASTLTMVRRTKLNPTTRFDSELYWYMTERDAEFWANDPDCKHNDCGKPGIWDGPPSEGLTNPGALCWAMRNPDHFGENPVWEGANWPGAPTQFSLDHDPEGRDLRRTLARFIPRDNHQAQDWFTSAAQSIGRGFSAKKGDVRVARSALRLAFNACHYVEDQFACGHPIGNRVCLPNPTGRPDQPVTPSQACIDFVNANTPQLTPEDQTIVSQTIGGGLVCDALVSGFQINESVRYAAAERFIRHHARGRQLTDGTTNPCIEACPTGECLAGAANEVVGTEPAWNANSCTQLLGDTLRALDDNPRNYLSRNYEVDHARQCRKVSNRATCTVAGGKCNIYSNDCEKWVDGGVLMHRRVILGTCNESASFGGNLLPPCNNQHTADAQCVDKCRFMGGFVDGDGKCLVTSDHHESFMPEQFRGVQERDVTALACGADLASAQPGHGGCTDYTNAQICYHLGGTCVEGYGENGYGMCSDRTPSPDRPYINQDLNALGTCNDGPGFAPGFLPNCYPRAPLPSISSTIRFCMTGSCQSDADCCLGMRCGQPGNPYTPAHDGTDTCQSIDSCGYDWLGFRGVGPGSVSLLPGGGGGTTCPPGSSCGVQLPGCGFATLTAQPQPGASLTAWSGCDSASGNTCTVSTSTLHRVQATFASCSPYTSCAAQGRTCGSIWNGCSTETCGSWGGGCPGGQTCSASGQCTSTTTLQLAGVYNQSWGYDFHPWTTLILWGTFASSGNAVRLRSPATGTEVWLYQGDGHYFWESPSQINASIDYRAGLDTWEVTVYAYGQPSNTAQIVITN